jgi:hypothetical protein
MAIEVFQITWTKHFPLDKALDQPEAKEGGIYALFKGTASSKRLHLIGKTKEFMGRFSTRKQYAANMMTETERKNCHVCFGLISSFDISRMSNNTDDTQLRYIESFFINKFNPEGNDPSTKKGYKGSPIIIINGGKVTKPFEKVMTHNPDLIKLLKKNLKTSRSSDSSYYF